ncbi:MAG: GMC family oxidoreductase [Myxococcota bacterium]
MVYDIIAVGSGFSTSFFLKRYLERRRVGRVLVLEAGPHRDHATQLAGLDSVNHDAMVSSYDMDHPEKGWKFTLAFGGGSNCWWACTPRMLPEDFALRSRYGVGADWPLTYDDLETYYCDAEEMLGVSGDSQDTPFVRSRPYPQPPHAFNAVDKLLKAAHPNGYYHQPTARARRPTSNRPGCCNNGVCELCPIDAKFTIRREMRDLYAADNVTLRTGARVQAVEMAGGRATGVRWLEDGQERTARGSLIVLGANALFNAHILLRSGFEHPQLGRGLVEQVSQTALVYLDGLDNLQGSTSITGHGYTAYAGPHRATRAAGLIENYNTPVLRTEPGRWRQLAQFKFIYEDLRQDKNRIVLQADAPERPRIIWEGISDYAQRALDHRDEDLKTLCASLPVEQVAWLPPAATEAHLMGSHVMGTDPAGSIVDPDGVHHQVRNLVVLGSGSFPTAAPANPTLTICAIALRSADRLGATA